MKKFVRGYPTTPPFWLLILEAADNNPLEAQRMESELTGWWWTRYMAWRKEYGKHLDEQDRKARRTSGKK